jgi:hypothetical protein
MEYKNRMEDTRAAQLQEIRAHCQKPGSAVLFDEPGALLLDVFSAKTVPLDVSSLRTVESRLNTQTKATYLLLIYDDGRQRALSDVGIAFAPSLTNTGPLPDLPEVVCFRDYQTLLDRLKHELYGHADTPPTRGTVQLLMMCIAIIDGARNAGFEVGREEQELETHLRELEKRAPPLMPS